MERPYPSNPYRTDDPQVLRELLIEAEGEITWALRWREDLDLGDPYSLRISEAIRVYFTHGQCHALALAIHARYGYPLMGCYFETLTVRGVRHRSPAHVYVRLPHGLNLDVCGQYRTGRHADPAMNHDDEQQMSRAEVEALAEVTYHPPRMEGAELFAEAVVRQYCVTPERFARELAEGQQAWTKDPQLVEAAQAMLDGSPAPAPAPTPALV